MSLNKIKFIVKLKIISCQIKLACFQRSSNVTQIPELPKASELYVHILEVAGYFARNS
jgi:hypothetical protein